MTTATITNPKSGKEYTLTVHNGKAIGCSCNQKKALEAYSPFAACKHMKEYVAPKPVVEQTPAQPEVLWSNVCGHRVRFDVDSHCGCMA